MPTSTQAGQPQKAFDPDEVLAAWRAANLSNQFGNISLAPRFGAGSLMALVVAGQLAAAMVLDHFALPGFQQHGFNLPRAIGAILLIAGAVLVSKF